MRARRHHTPVFEANAPIFTSKELPVGRGLEDPLLRRFYGEQRATSLGSGVIVSRDGYVLTNNHVVEGADEIAVMLPGNRNIAARIVGTDPDTDLAVLKMKADNLIPITFGDSDRIKIGVEIQDVTTEVAAYLKLKRPGGAVVTSVVRGSPADKGGLEPGDVVQTIAGKPVEDTATLISETAKLSPGQRMELEVLRKGKGMRLSVIAGTRPASRVRK